MAKRKINIPVNLPKAGKKTLAAAKDKLRIVVATQQYKIEGDIHIYENSRLSDMLNSDKHHNLFIPLTNVICYSIATGEQLFKRNFLTVSKSFITMVYVDEHSSQAAENFIASGKNFLAAGNYKDAKTESRKAIAIDPENAEAHYILGLSFGKSNELNEALKEFQLAMEYGDPKTEIYHLASDMKNQLKL